MPQSVLGQEVSFLGHVQMPMQLCEFSFSLPLNGFQFFLCMCVHLIMYYYVLLSLSINSFAILFISRSRVRKAGGKKFGNDVFSVEFETPVDETEPPPIFGAQYNFHMEGVVDCPEFLVHFPTFIR